MAPFFTTPGTGHSAGLFYGRAWLASDTLAAPVLVHTLVDSVWPAFFEI